MFRTHLFALACLATSAHAATIHVKPAADPESLASGSSWETATNLQRALTFAQPGDEVWIASGKYYPDEGQGQTDNDHNARFTLPDGVKIFGQFNGTESLRSERNLKNAEPTIFSGDITQDDLTATAFFPRATDIVGENSNHIATAITQSGKITLADITFVGGENGAISASKDYTLNLLRCRFFGNKALRGAAINARDTTLSIVACHFAGNQTDIDGGALYLIGGTLKASESVFNDNHAGGDGGAITTLSNTATYQNCTFGRNICGFRGGAVFNWSTASSTFSNSIIWGNTSTFYVTGTNSSVRANGQPNMAAFSNCILEYSGGSEQWNSSSLSDLGGNLDTDPFFMPKGVSPSSALALQPYSPAIDAGKTSDLAADFLDSDDNLNSQELSPSSFGGGARQFGIAPDIGAAEYHGSQATALVPTPRFSPGASTISDYIDLAAVFGETPTTVSLLENSNTPLVTINLVAGSPLVGLTIHPLKTGKVSVLLGITLPNTASTQLAFEITVAPSRIFVDATGETGANGLSWESAMPSLQDALTIASENSEIWVTQGTYHPDIGFGIARGDENATFLLNKNIKLLGGFTGTEMALTDRAIPAEAPTVLSGFLGIQVDPQSLPESPSYEPSELPSRLQNVARSKHILTLHSGSSSAIIEGFTIIGGYADSKPPINRGGGLFSVGSAAIVRDCLFRNNRAHNSDARGGAAYSRNGSSPDYDICQFFFNSAHLCGGAIYHDKVFGAEIKNCNFIGNGANSGGAAHIANSETRISASTFSANEADYGGALHSRLSNLTLSKSSFTRNIGRVRGSALFAESSTATSSQLISENCVYSGNISELQGIGTIYIGSNVTPQIRASTISGNYINRRLGALIIEGSNSPPGSVVIGSIIWNNVDGSGKSSSVDANDFNNSLTFINSNIQGSGGSSGWNSHWGQGSDGGGNIDADPQFIQQGDPNGVPPTLGDLRLTANSPAIDQFEPQPEDTNLDFNGNARSIDGDFNGIPFADMGAFEYDPAKLDSDQDGVLDSTEHSISGSAIDLAGPKLGISANPIRLEVTYDSRLAGLIDLKFESTPNLSPESPWIETEIAPMSSTTEGLTTQRVFNLEHSTSRRFYRLRTLELVDRP